MSITVSNCNEICNCPLNISKSKMLYTFAKSQRFHSTKKILYFLSESRCDKFYNLPSTVDSHTSTFGYGTKFDFTKWYFLAHTVSPIRLRQTPTRSRHSLTRPRTTRWDLGSGREGRKCSALGRCPL